MAIHIPLKSRCPIKLISNRIRVVYLRGFIGHFYIHGTYMEVEDPTRIDVHNLDIIICLLDFCS